MSGTAPNLTYNPANNYNGPDSFTFKVNDGTVDSADATVSITVNAVNDPPTADAQSVTTAEDAPTGITLTGSDPDGDSLTYVITSNPSHGSLSGTAPSMTYTPAADYSGPDAFSFKVNDGTVDSPDGTVSITVGAVNDLPTANAQSVTTGQNTPKAITLTASDPEEDPLTYTITGNPSHGSLSGTAPNVTYTPATNYNGSDSFTFKVNDGTTDSADAAVSITVTSPVTADLKITVSDSKTAIAAGIQDTYKITVTNSGPSSVTGATVADTFPGDLTNVTFTATQTGGASGFTASGTDNINDTVTMPSGSKIIYSAKGKVSAAATGTISNTATVTAPGGVSDPNTANNSATDTDTITNRADLRVTVNDNKTAAVAGAQNTYTIIVTNGGPSNASGASYSGQFPEHIHGGNLYCHADRRCFRLCRQR